MQDSETNPSINKIYEYHGSDYVHFVIDMEKDKV